MRILAKDNHLLLKKSLNLQYARKKHLPETFEEYEPTKLLLQNIPADIEEEHFHLYLSSCLKMDVEKDFSVKRVGDIAIITFKKEFLMTGKFYCLMNINKANPIMYRLGENDFQY